MKQNLPSHMGDRIKVALVAEHASVKFGGEAALPFHYFRVLYQRGVDVRLIVHERTKEELRASFPDAGDRIVFISDTWLNRFLWKLGEVFPSRVAYFTTGWLSRVATQMTVRPKLRELVRDGKINLVHQIIPVSPKEPSLMFGLDVPVVIGPMNGGMSYPEGFKSGHHVVMSRLAGVGNLVASALNRLMPGKRRADVVLVANGRTRAALPGKDFRRIVQVVENGVDLNIWNPGGINKNQYCGTPCNFVFVGRLIELKGVDLLLEAFSRLKNIDSSSLLIIGDGPSRMELAELTRRKNLLMDEMSNNCRGKVVFCGWKSQEECAEILANSDALILPSLMECGGAVVLEAMAMALPVIATDWGGPADYLDDSCGILVDPVNPTEFVEGLVAAMEKLAAAPELRERLGRNGREKVLEMYDWERKVDRMMEIYDEALNGNGNLH